MTTRAVRSSTTETVSKKARTRSGTSRPSSANRPSASAVSVDSRRPPVRAGVPGVDRKIDGHGYGHAGEPSRERKGESSPLAQVTEVELAARLQTDDEEEQHHQPAVDPGPQ